MLLKKLKDIVDNSSSISASILSFALTIIGFSNFEITAWWHYIATVLVVFVVYVFFYILIEIIAFLYKRYFERANIESDINDEIEELEEIIDNIDYKIERYEKTSIEGYKVILFEQICCLNIKATNKIKFIENSCESETKKNKFKIPNAEEFKKYKEFCNEISNTYKYNGHK